MPAALFDAPFELAAVGYNLRFHPVMVALADAVAGSDCLTMQAYCGQWLPDWRPGTDYREVLLGRSRAWRRRAARS